MSATPENESMIRLRELMAQNQSERFIREALAISRIFSEPKGIAYQHTLQFPTNMQPTRRQLPLVNPQYSESVQYSK